MAATLGSLAAISAAAAVDVVSSVATPGRLADSQARHCASPWGCESTRLTSERSEARDNRYCAISR